MALVIINHYLVICVFICLSSISSHWTLIPGEGVRRGEEKDIFSMSLKSQNVLRSACSEIEEIINVKNMFI